MRHLFFLILGVSILSCQQSDRQEGVAKDASEEAIQFLEEILTDTSQSGFIQDQYYVLADDPSFLPPAKLEEGKASEADIIAKALQEDDKTFIQSQLRRQRSFSIAALRGKGFTMVPLRSMESQQITSDSLWRFVNQQYESGFYSVSMPVFSSDFQKAYVRVGQLCGPDCGGGETRIYEYKNDVWELMDVVEVWVI